MTDDQIHDMLERLASIETHDTDLRDHPEAYAAVRRFIKSSTQPEPLTDERIDAIADITARGMEDGMRGFMKVWGWRHFARNLLEACGQRVATKDGAMR